MSNSSRLPTISDESRHFTVFVSRFTEIASDSTNVTFDASALLQKLRIGSMIELLEVLPVVVLARSGVKRK